MARAAGVAALLAMSLLAAVSWAGGGRILAVQGTVGWIAAEEGFVAVRVHPAKGCDYVLTWKPSAGRTSRFVHCSSSDYSLQDLTFAGGVPIWWDYSTGNHVYCDDVYAGRHALGLCDGTEGDTYYEFGGDRTIAAIVDFSVCEDDCTDNGKLLPNGNYSVEVRQLANGNVVPLLSPVDFRVFLDAGNRRVATIEPKATLTVWDATGKKLWSLPGITGVFGGWVDGGTVVLHQTRSLHVYSQAGSGVTRPLPRGAVVVRVVGGLAVYFAGSSLHVLRLRDGRDRKLLPVSGAADFTSAGIFYGGVRSVTFMPLAGVLRKLR
jgi:hypothetical protein